MESAKNFDKTKRLKEFGIDGINVSKLTFNWEKEKKGKRNFIQNVNRSLEACLKKNGVEIIRGNAIKQQINQ